MTTFIEMRVDMDCTGCQSKIRKALKKLDGVGDVDIDMAMQKVTVTGWVDQRKVLKAVKKTGKRAVWPYPYIPDEYHNHAQQYYPQQQQLIIQSEAAPMTHQLRMVPTASSSYNYYEPRYDGHDDGYYQQPVYSSVVEQSRLMFSDDNPYACSIM
ncbi:hypothetical protein SLE2022_304130 [Rubroshorea leprosula]